MKRFIKSVSIVTAMAALLSGCIDGGSSSESKLKIVHMNDTHSHIESESLDLYFDGDNDTKTYAEVGGMAKAAAYIKQLKADNDNELVLHAGDAVQGTLYYTLFKGKADAAVLNEIGFDAMAIGNHEFDDGDQFLADFIDMLNMPVISANVVPAAGNILDGKFTKYIIKEVKGTKYAIVGLTISGKTKESSNPSDEITFEDEAEALQKTVNELKKKGIQKIIVLSHYGYKQTQEMAAKVTDIDIIVDGDSHSLLGDYAYLGLDSEGSYPTMTKNKDGQNVCIVQGWEYGKVVGVIDAVFDGDALKSCTGAPKLILADTLRQKINDEKVELEGDARQSKIDMMKAKGNVLYGSAADQQTSDIIAQYSSQVDDMKNKIIGEASEDLYHGRVPNQPRDGQTLPLGSDIAPIVAKSFYDLSNRADICIQNAGGVRISVTTGDITIGTAYTLLPFANTLFEIEMKGSEIKQVLEDAVENIATGGSSGAFPYAYALKYDVDSSKGKYNRFSNLEIKDRKTGEWSAIDMNKMYVVVTNSYIAAGKDGYDTFATVQEERGKGVDTYLDYAMSFVQYVEKKEKSNDTVTKLPAEDHPIKSYISDGDKL